MNFGSIKHLEILQTFEIIRYVAKQNSRKSYFQHLF